MPPSRNSRSASSHYPKRQKMSEQGVVIVSKEEVAARRIQRVWRLIFRHLLTKTFVVRFLDPEAGISIQKIKTIRFDRPFLFYVFTCMLNSVPTTASSPS